MVTIKKLYVNFEASLLIEASFDPRAKCLRCSGKKVTIEVCEMNTICVDQDKFYQLGEMCEGGELMEVEVMV